MKKELFNWSVYPKVTTEELQFSSSGELQSLLHSSKSLIARGNGRSYGDASLNENTTVSTLYFDKFLDFDRNTGVLTAQSGLLLSEILDVIVPSGWFLPVTPGTKFITLGGAIAADVHGKNHHKEGSISDHTLFLDVMIESGETIRCSKNENEDLFQATCGGMGLTGIITTVGLQLKKINSPKIEETRIKAKNLGHLVDLLDKYEDVTYSVAWVDSMTRGKKMGRGILMLGEHYEPSNNGSLHYNSKSKINVPFTVPHYLLNRPINKVFNSVLYNKEVFKKEKSLINFDPFFYPLDGITNWNRLYGNKGFLQYQFALPDSTGAEGLEAIMKKICHSGVGSFVSVLKKFGEQRNGMMSFPMKGFTLALDFQITDKLFQLFNDLDELVLKYKGRIYSAKDARMSRSTFHESYPNLEEFCHVVKKYNPSVKFSSMLSDRLISKDE